MKGFQINGERDVRVQVSLSEILLAVRAVSWKAAPFRKRAHDVQDLLSMLRARCVEPSMRNDCQRITVALTKGEISLMVGTLSELWPSRWSLRMAYGNLMDCLVRRILGPEASGGNSDGEVLVVLQRQQLRLVYGVLMGLWMRSHYTVALQLELLRDMHGALAARAQVRDL